MKPLQTFALCALFAVSACSKKAALPPKPTFTFAPLEVPDARGTEPYGIVGDKIFGTFIGKDGYLRAFLYDVPSAKFTTIEEQSPLMFPIPTGLSGDTLVGFANSATGFHGFFYDLPTRQFTVFDHPNAGKFDSPVQHDSPGTFITGINSATFYGYYRDDAGIPHGFLCDRKSRRFTPVTDPAAIKPFGSAVTAVSERYLTGYEVRGEETHGFVCDPAAKIFTAIIAPYDSHDTEPAGISDGMIVGTAVGGTIHHAFTYDIATQAFTTFDHPGSQPPPATGPATGYSLVIVGETFATGISGNTIVGYYSTPAGEKHGYIATIH